MNRIILFAAQLLIVASQAFGASPKRGVCVTSITTDQMDLLAPGVSWYYNWGVSSPLPAIEGMDFVPMGWSGINADALRAYCKNHPEVKYLLGFNEPNFSNQANLTPAEAAEKWPEMKALAAELGLKLVAPALNYSTGTYAQPTKWMDEFVALTGPDAFDYTAIHCYGGEGLLRSFASEFYERYGKPVWVTEFCQWPGGAGNVYVAPETQIESMIASVQWLEQSEAIHRYSWFMATGPYDAENRPNYGLLKVGGTLSEPVYSLSPQGYVYTYMSTFDKSQRVPENQWHPAALCTDASNVSYGHGSDAATGYPLVVNRLTASTGWIEYQFEIEGPADEAKMLLINVGGYGEPKRFDPTLTITATHADGTTAVTIADNQKFTLPGHDECDSRIALEFKAPKPGLYTLRIADTGRSSGIILGSLLIGAKSGIADVSADGQAGPVDVYTPAGALLRRGVDPASATAGLPAGLYIVGNRKVAVK